MVLGGVIQMLSPQAGGLKTSAAPENTPGYAFGSAKNTTASGNPGGFINFDGGSFRSISGGDFLAGDQKVIAIGRGNLLIYSVNGSIDSGRELFGVDTFKGNGQLAMVTGNGDGQWPSAVAKVVQIHAGSVCQVG